MMLGRGLRCAQLRMALLWIIVRWSVEQGLGAVKMVRLNMSGFSCCRAEGYTKSFTFTVDSISQSQGFKESMNIKKKNMYVDTAVRSRLVHMMSA